MYSRQHTHQRRGTIMIWLGVFMLVLIGFVGLASDTGLVMLAGNELQNSSDASALAAARLVKSDQTLARQAPVDVANANQAAHTNVVLSLNNGNAADGDIVVGHYDRSNKTFTPTMSSPNAVKVVARRTADAHGGVTLVFGTAFNVDDANVVRTAIAMVGGGAAAGMIALCGDCECAIRVTGNADIVVNDGGIQVNSSNECALCMNGNADIEAVDINVVGDLCLTGNSDIEGDVNTDGAPVPDPLAGVPDPPWSPASDLGTINVNGNASPPTFQPGYYSGGIRLRGNSSSSFAPGIYVVDGFGLEVSGNADMFAEEVMFFVIGNGQVDLAGNGDIHITPPDSGTYEGISIFQARDNDNEARIIGNADLDLQGTLYFPNAHLEVGGNGDGFGNQLIAWTIWTHGNADLTINYNGSFPAPGNTVFLVE